MMLPIRGLEFDETNEVEILVDGGPLVIANAWNWGKRSRRADLYRIYHKRSGLPIGPHYAAITLAQQGLKAAMGIPNAKAIWAEDVAYFNANRWVRTWVLKELGKSMDLIGGSWCDEKGNPVRE